jgi:phosphoesterase RecJ-like protein
MSRLEELIEGKNRIAIGGHVRPDGDCVGSTSACAKYIMANYPEKEVVVYLEKPMPEIAYLFNGVQLELNCEEDEIEEYDLFICMDCEKTRLGFAEPIFDKAKATVNVDHHISNKGCADVDIIYPKASSTGEILYGLLDPEKLTKEIAESIYVAVIHDTGVFQYSNTSPKTFEVASHLISFGFDFPKIIEDTFYKRTLLQTRILGDVLLSAKVALNGAFIFGGISQEEMERFHVNTDDFEGIVNQLRNVENVECAAFIYEKMSGVWKVSLRSTDRVDASKICETHGGGGHKKAAGCMIEGSKEDIMEILKRDVKNYL